MRADILGSRRPLPGISLECRGPVANSFSETSPAVCSRCSTSPLPISTPSPAPLGLACTTTWLPRTGRSVAALCPFRHDAIRALILLLLLSPATPGCRGPSKTLGLDESIELCAWLVGVMRMCTVARICMCDLRGLQGLTWSLNCPAGRWVSDWRPLQPPPTDL